MHFKLYGLDRYPDCSVFRCSYYRRPAVIKVVVLLHDLLVNKREIMMFRNFDSDYFNMIDWLLYLNAVSATSNYFDKLHVLYRTDEKVLYSILLKYSGVQAARKFLCDTRFN